tara:strand:- start:4318 stop:5910 length:1593 start_codon:yes stop_codon:yes gene_type:complete
MILSKSEYLASIKELLPDNSTQQISPEDLRTSLTDLVDSVHKFLEGHAVTAANIASPDTRTTRVGSLALDKLQYVGRTSTDNSAFGYYALGANYQSSGNTALGSHALGCNLYGDYNTAIGINSIAGNTVGSGNTSVGSLSLQTNRQGNFNIAIGHGAGSHIGENVSNKFYLGVDPIDTATDCDALSSSGAFPLLYGDTSTLHLAVATNSLHGHGTLQVSGDVTPSHSGAFNLGNENYNWSSVNEIIHFSGSPQKIGVGTAAPSGDQALMTVKGNVVPETSDVYALGHEHLRWDGYFNDILVSGRAVINDYTYQTITECLYDCKTLHLATSGMCATGDLGFAHGGVCGYMSDESLEGAGFEVHSSGSDYRRDYKFIYRAPDASLTCLELDNVYSRSRWQSNISMEITSGNHLQTERILSDEKFSIVKQSGCYGLFMNSYLPSGNRAFISTEDHVDAGYATLEDVNFLSQSGTHVGDDTNPSLGTNPSGYDFNAMYGTVDSGVQVGVKFATRIKSSSTMRGFSLQYHDERDA